MSHIKLMYITNSPEVALIAEKSGVDRIFIDMEYIGKAQRQGGMDTVQSHHTIEDIKAIKSVITKSEIMVRCNPIHDATDAYCSSKEEIDAIVESGADIIMLPYFTTADEVREFVRLVGGRAKTFPLVENKEAVAAIDEILEIEGIDEIYIGLNDLSLSRGQRFMFQPLADGMVDMLSEKFKEKGIPFGFGGIASLGKGLLPSEYVICEHKRLGSTAAILSRSFCNVAKIGDLSEIDRIFTEGVRAVREFEAVCSKNTPEQFMKNHTELVSKEKTVAKNTVEICGIFGQFVRFILHKYCFVTLFPKL